MTYHVKSLPDDTPWASLREALARELDLSEDDLKTFEAYWGGEYGDDDGAELVTYEGRLIGAINRQLTREEYALICTIPHFGDVNKTTDAERATSFPLAAE